MPDVTRPRSVAPARSEERADNRAREEKLDLGREGTGSMPTAAAVKQLAPAWAQKRYDVLQVGSGACRCSKCRGIQRAASTGEEGEACKATTDLKSARADVLMWQTIRGEVEDRPDENGGKPGSAGGTGCGTCSDVEGNDHGSALLSTSSDGALAQAQAWLLHHASA